MIKAKSKISISATCSSALRPSYITFQHCVLCTPVTLAPPPSCSSGTQCHNTPVRKKFCWFCMLFVKALPQQSRGQKGRCSRWVYVRLTLLRSSVSSLMYLMVYFRVCILVRGWPRWL